MKSQINSQQLPITKECIVMKTRKQFTLSTKIRSYGIGLVLNQGFSSLLSPPTTSSNEHTKNTTLSNQLTGYGSIVRFMLSALLVATMNLTSLFAAEPLLALTFEKDKSMEGVKIGSSTKIIDEGYESACALEACSEQNTFQSFLTTQRYPVDGSKEVLALSFDYKTSEAIANEFIAMIFYYGEGGEQLFVEYVKIPASDQWKSFSYTGKKPPKGTLSAALTLRLAGAPAQASVCIDNLVLTKKSS